MMPGQDDPYRQFVRSRLGLGGGPVQQQPQGPWGQPQPMPQPHPQPQSPWLGGMPQQHPGMGQPNYNTGVVPPRMNGPMFPLGGGFNQHPPITPFADRPNPDGPYIPQESPIGPNGPMGHPGPLGGPNGPPHPGNDPMSHPMFRRRPSLYDEIG